MEIYFDLVNLDYDQKALDLLEHKKALIRHLKDLNQDGGVV